MKKLKIRKNLIKVSLYLKPQTKAAQNSNHIMASVNPVRRSEASTRQ